MNINSIIKILPHRYPFLLVDKVLDVQKDSVHAIKNVTINEEFFNGHFPGHPVMPGVLIMEALAQACILTVSQNFDKNFLKEKLVYFATMDKVYFKKPVVPGDTLHLHAKKINQKMNMWKMATYAKVENVEVAKAILSAVVTDKND